MIDDFQDSGDEDSSDEEGSSEDEDFIAADGSYEEGASSEDDGSDDAGSGDDGTAVEAALRRKMKQKVAVAMQQAGPVASINGAVRNTRCYLRTRRTHSGVAHIGKPEGFVPSAPIALQWTTNRSFTQGRVASCLCRPWLGSHARVHGRIHV